jgi:transcriptional regulator GlxA family with amidase domain
MAPIQFGVLLIPFQLMDCAGPLDVLSSSSRKYIQEAEEFGGPRGLAEKAIDIEFHYIAETLEPVLHTANFQSVPSTTCATCPPLDYLLIGGPKPDYMAQMPTAMVEFIRSRAKEVKLLFTTCTGGMVAAHAGVLNGKNATTNHGAVPIAKQIYPDVKWTAEKQWVVDGNTWTAGGACAGMDMMAHWVIENYGMDVAVAGFIALDYKPRDVEGKLLPYKTRL